MAIANRLTPDMITRETLRLIHQKANFLGMCWRQYDGSFAQQGAKIGDTLRIRLPVQFTVLDDTRALTNSQFQDPGENQVSLQIQYRTTIPFQFDDEELTLSVDAFRERYLEKAAAKMASRMEQRVMGFVYPQIYQQVYYDPAATGADAFDTLVDSMALLDSVPTPNMNRYANVDEYFHAQFIKDNKDLFHPQGQISREYREGMIAGSVAGFDMIYKNSIWPTHTYGNDAGGPQTTGIINSAAVGYDGGNASTKFNAGDLITFASVNAVHLETGEDTGALKTFSVVTGDDAGATGSITIAPVPVATGAYKNVTALPADNAAITLARGYGQTTAPGDGDKIKVGIGMMKEAIAFATADLEMPRNSSIDMASRIVSDGISLRFLRGYDVKDSVFYSRFDCLWGIKVLRPEFSLRLARKLP